MNRNILKNSAIVLILSLLLSSSVIASQNNSISEEFIIKEDYSLNCYGFIVPLPAGNDTTYETFLNSKVRSLVNDLLRENIDVYWSSENFSILTKKIDNTSNIFERNFKKGDFIIPFTGIIYKDVLINAIIYDYNLSSEIEDESNLQLEIYKIMSSLEINSYKLVESKIVQHLGRATRYGWPAYLEVAESGGFFSIDFFLDGEATKYLNNQDYNIFIWPYNPARATLFEVLYTTSNKDDCNAIRNFVKNGGGFVGSCYGATIGSSGFLFPIPIISLKNYYNIDVPIKRPSVTLSLSDSLMSAKWIGHIPIFVTTLEIEDINHPISYGVEKIHHDFFNGAWFSYLGENSKNIARFVNLESQNKADSNPIYKKMVIGSPERIYSQFGKGKVVLFAGHPEFVNNISILFEAFEWEGDKYYGRRTIHNTLFYLTSEDLTEIILTFSYPVDEIEKHAEKTINLILVNEKTSRFDYIKNKILDLNHNLSKLKTISYDLNEIYSNIINENRLIRFELTYLSYYMYYYSGFFNERAEKAVSVLDKLEQVYPSIIKYNGSIEELADDLINDISNRLNESEKILKEIDPLLYHLKDFALQKRNLIQDFILYSKSKYLLRTFVICLKYIPQIYYESLKLLRSLWYNFQANFAIVNNYGLDGI